VFGQNVNNVTDSKRETPSRRFAFPDHDDLPTLASQTSNVSCIPATVCENFRSPKFGIGLRYVASWASVPVPKTPVDKQDGAALCENQVRLTGKTLAVQSVSEALGMQSTSQQKLWLSVA
jgi:hypothetical protein